MCTKRSLGQVGASAQSDQSSQAPLRVAKYPECIHADSEDSVLDGRTWNLVGKAVARLICRYVAFALTE